MSVTATPLAAPQITLTTEAERQLARERDMRIAAEADAASLRAVLVRIGHSDALASLERLRGKSCD